MFAFFRAQRRETEVKVGSERALRSDKRISRVLGLAWVRARSNLRPCSRRITDLVTKPVVPCSSAPNETTESGSEVAEASSGSFCGVEGGGATYVRAGTGVGVDARSGERCCGGGATCVRAGGRLLRVFPREVGLALGDKREKRLFESGHGDVLEI